MEPATRPMRAAVVDLPDLPAQAALLWEMVERATGNPWLREVLARLMRARDLPARNPAALARAVQEFVQRNVKYLREKPETYVHPLRTLTWGVGDCDDMAILVCALLRSAAIPCRLAFVGWAPRGAPGRVPFKHLLPEAWVDDRWTALECVRPLPLGWHVAAEQARRGNRVRVLVHGDQAPGAERAA